MPSQVQQLLAGGRPLLSDFVYPGEVLNIRGLPIESDDEIRVLIFCEEDDALTKVFVTPAPTGESTGSIEEDLIDQDNISEQLSNGEFIRDIHHSERMIIRLRTLDLGAKMSSIIIAHSLTMASN